MNKREIRKLYLEKRNALSEKEVRDLSDRIFSQFIAYFKPTENQSVHLFLPIVKKREIDTTIFVNYFFENNIRVFVPKISGNEMISIELHQETVLAQNALGIMEPEGNQEYTGFDFDYVITPLLYCDNRGNRVGYGKGFYDAFFRKINQDSLKIGVNYFNPAETIDDIRKDDIPLDYLVTPTEVLSFSGLTSKLTK